MIIRSSDLECVAALADQYPDTSLPEIAFCGRSNVGKSSFINAFLNRKNLARASQTPGKTRTVNFYRVNDDFRLVDLPGYGYAAVSKGEKASWTKIIETYLNERENLAEAILLVDIRHKPTDLDIQMYHWIIESGFTGFVIATKLDKIPRGQWKKAEKRIKDTLGMESVDLILPYSSTAKTNQDLVHDQIEVIVETYKQEMGQGE